MVLDTSAILAILLLEPDRATFAGAIAGATTRLVSAGTLLELSIVLESRNGAAGATAIDDFILKSRIVVMPFNAEQVAIAREAYRRFGRGRHPAGLNFGDCFAYALSKTSGEPLLFKGDDFARTDVARC